jgi:hypothetical protein
VAEQLTDDLGVDAEPKQQRRRAVAQILEAEARQAGPVEQRGRTTGQEVPRVERSPHGVREDEILIVPGCAKLATLLVLPDAMRDQRLGGGVW